MSIELLKELEDLKQANAKLWSQIKTIKDAKIEKAINEALSDFEKFFKEKGFHTTPAKQSITAIYGNLNAIINYDVSEKTIFGAEFYFNLSLHMPNVADYTVGLNPKEDRGGTSGRSTIIPNDPKKKLEYEIERAKEEQEYAKDRMKKIPDEIWDYELKFKDRHRPVTKTQKFDSMYELLNSLIR